MKKLLSFVLIVVMLLTLLPIAVQAAEITVGTGGTYTDLQTAIDNATSGDTIKIMSDIDVGVLTGVTIANKSITIDLNGKTISYSGGGAAIRFNNALIVSCELKDSTGGGSLTASGTGAAIEVASGTLYMRSVIVSATGAGNAIGVLDSGTLGLYGGTVSATSGGKAISSSGLVNVHDFAVVNGDIDILDGNFDIWRTFNNTGNFTNAANLRNRGTFNNTGILTNNGYIYDNGTYSGSGSFTNNGTIKPTITISPSPTITVTKGNAATLTATAKTFGQPHTLKWYVDGVVILGATSATYSPDTSAVGTKTYKCEVSGIGIDTTSSSDVTVTVINPPPSGSGSTSPNLSFTYNIYNWSGNSNGIAMKCNGEYTDFTELYVDGDLLRKGTDYTVRSGSTIFTIKASYLKKLANGDHTVTAYYTNGYAQTTLTINGNPKTGDESNVVLWGLLAVLTVGGLGFVLKKKVWVK